MSDSVRVLEPEGIIDSAGGNQIRRKVVDLLEAGAETLLIDLKNITFMDSSGLGAMVATLQTVRKREANLFLCSLNDQVQIIMEMTKMDKVFTILPDRTALDRTIES
ncbi:STAS domain-containing protein [Tumidithrix elongata RA019]|uniref:Anti-sigma factor antagonist n=1 Tax=Tumidithrix elongata BACA0141 TaxID=2716417 RepID=A0AAW9PYB0_9CYAN|nr:STAS domain-containing protein [Tumidithrix elongata RA019]